MDTDARQILEHAMQPIVDEMFKNGTEEGCRIWEDASHPLHQAFAILMRAHAQFMDFKAAAALLERHRAEWKKTSQSKRSHRNARKTLDCS